MMINSFKDWLDFLVFDTIKAKIEDIRKGQQIKKRISDYTQRYIQQFEIFSHDEEFDLMYTQYKKIQEFLLENNKDMVFKLVENYIKKNSTC